MCQDTATLASAESDFGKFIRGLLFRGRRWIDSDRISSSVLFLIRAFGISKLVTGVGIESVEFCQSIVYKKIIGQKQVAVIGWAVPHRIFKEKIERGLQFGDDCGGEAREKFFVFRQIFDSIHLQPMMEKALHFCVGASVVHHLAGLLRN